MVRAAAKDGSVLFRVRASLLVLCALVILSPNVRAAGGPTYYVDPATGSNANAGDRPDAPWQNPPGTRTPDGSAFYSSSWGSITAENKLPPGAAILLRGGRTQTADEGGAWRMDPTFYPPALPEDGRITIRVATAGEWPGSSGPFVLDGEGVTPSGKAFGLTPGGFGALVDVWGLDSITLAGAGPSQRLVVRKAGPPDPRVRIGGVLVFKGSRFKAEWLELADNALFGFEAGRLSDWVVRNTISHDNGGPGFATGLLNNHRTARGAFVDVETCRNGKGEGATYGDALVLIGCESIWVVRCRSHDNEMRGANSGEVGPPLPDLSYRWRDFESWNNGINSAQNPGVARYGFGFSGDDRPGGATQSNYMVRAIVYRNPGAGGWLGYGNGRVEVWNSVFWGNAHERRDLGAFVWDRTSEDAGVFNTIVQKRPYNNFVWSWSNANPRVQLDAKPLSDHNIYQPAASDDEGFGSFNFQTGAFGRERRTFAQAAAGLTGFTGPHDLIGLRFDPRFIATDDARYESNNFRLGPGSAAVDLGAFLMRAEGGGGGTTVRVMGNGMSNDPRNYFIGPDSYPDAVADTIQIEGAGRVTITAMTADAISFTPALTWTDGAGIHLPWAGRAPDIGAFEVGIE